jgi:putative flippase GtrA
VWVRRFIRYTAGSALATLASAGAFAVVFHVNGGPRLASLAGFVSGAAVNFVAARFWAWSRRGPVRLGRDMAIYLAVAISIALAATAVTSLTDHYARRSPALADHLALVVEGAYFATYGAVFLLKFAILDRLVFRPRPHPASDYPAGVHVTSDYPAGEHVTSGYPEAATASSAGMGSGADAGLRPATAVKPSAPATGSSTYPGSW